MVEVGYVHGLVAVGDALKHGNESRGVEGVGCAFAVAAEESIEDGVRQVEAVHWHVPDGVGARRRREVVDERPCERRLPGARRPGDADEHSVGRVEESRDVLSNGHQLPRYVEYANGLSSTGTW